MLWYNLKTTHGSACSAFGRQLFLYCSRKIQSFTRKLQRFTRKIQEKWLFNKYVGIGGRLQPNFANFNLNFLSQYERVEKEVQTLESGIHPPFLNTDKLVKRIRLLLVYSTFLSVFRNQRMRKSKLCFFRSKLCFRHLDNQ